MRPNAAQIFEKELLAQSLDLKAGQAIDRVGGMLGLPFPAGAELDRLAQQSKRRFAVKPSMKGANCCLSGIQNQCQKMLHAGECREDIARFCIESVLAAIDAMAEELLRQDGTYPFLFAGGVMSNRVIRDAIIQKYDASFAEPSFSCDNAAGIAVLAAAQEKNLPREQQAGI